MSSLTCQTCGREYHNQNDYLRDTTRFRICTEGHLWFECSCHSGLVLQKGQFSWYTPQDRMSPEASEVFNTVSQLKKTPLMSSASVKLQAQIHDDAVSSKELESSLRRTPKVALQVLSSANHLKPAGVGEITHLEHAVSYLGRSILADLVMAASIQEFQFQTKSFSQDQYWQEAYMTGAIAEYIARNYAPNINKDEAYLAGCLCNVGKVLLAICMPDIADELHHKSNHPQAPQNWCQSEKQLNSISHSILGEVAGALWGFPDYLIHAIGNHHKLPNQVRTLLDMNLMFDEPEEAQTEKGPKLQEIIALANQYSHWVLLQPHRIDHDLLEQYGNVIGLSTKELDELGDAIHSYLHKQAG